MIPRFFFFDIGGVVLSNGWGHESRMKAAQRFGFDYDEMNHLHEFIFNIYEIGNISLDEYLDIVLFYRERSFTKKEFRDFMFSESFILPDMLEWLIQWKRQLPKESRIIAINNEGGELNEYRIRHFGLHRLFDAFVSSCEVGLRKPDPAIFRLALGIAQARPEESIYFDDRKFLAEAAQREGIPSHVHTSYEETKMILQQFLPDEQSVKG